MKKTIVLSVNPEAPDPNAIERAATVLRGGGLVAFPTETVYGLGANALDAGAVQGIFAAKERPTYDPLIVHLAEQDWLLDVVASVSPVVDALVARFWPGPLTLVLPKHDRIPSNVTAGGPTVAVRVPAHLTALALIRAAGVPVAAPSANRFGRVSPTQAEHVLDDLDGRIDLILDGGPTYVGVESTVLSMITATPTILRPGGIGREALEAVLGRVDVLERVVLPEEVVPSPGTLAKHYAPRARLLFYRGPRDTTLQAMHQETTELIEQGTFVGLLLADEDAGAFSDVAAEMQSVGSVHDLAGVARQLFAALRTLDQVGVGVILVRDFGIDGLGLAIRDRLTRAAGGRVITVANASQV
jgi:L-threonylcarbamoyladenylate synthase